MSVLASERRKKKHRLDQSRFLKQEKQLTPGLIPLFLFQIEVSECEPDALLEMLRHMYYDEVQLTMRTGPEVLFLARKYLIPSLA